MRRGLALRLLAIFAPVALASVLVAGGAPAATLDPPELALGERGTLHLDAAPADSTEWPVGLGSLVRATDDPLVWEVTAVRVGDVGVALPATADTLRWTVAGTIDTAAPERLRPLWSVGDLGPNWWPTLAVILAVLLPVLVWLWRRGRRPRAAQTPFELPAEPPHLVALRRLAEIEERGLIGARRFDDFYVEASHALREYIGGRFRVPALDWTSAEVVERLEAVGYEGEGIHAVDPLLRSADEVKFAAHRPSEHQAQDWLRSARAWIEETAVEPVYSTPEAVHAAADFNAGSR